MRETINTIIIKTEKQKPLKDSFAVTTTLDRQIKELQEEVSRLKNTLYKTIGLGNLNEIQFVPINTIVQLEAANNYTHFHLDNGDKITMSYTLKHYESILDSNIFLRVHQSHIINLYKVKKYIKGKGGYLVMEGGQIICVSPSRKNDFLSALNMV